MSSNRIDRRQALTTLGSSAAAIAALAAGNPGAGYASARTDDGKSSDAGNRLHGKAEYVVSIWLGGGMGQIDTFDPKRRGDPKAKVAGAYYDAIDTAVPECRSANT